MWKRCNWGNLCSARMKTDVKTVAQSLLQLLTLSTAQALCTTACACYVLAVLPRAISDELSSSWAGTWHGDRLPLLCQRQQQQRQQHRQDVRGTCVFNPFPEDPWSSLQLVTACFSLCYKCKHMKHSWLMCLIEETFFRLCTCVVCNLFWITTTNLCCVFCWVTYFPTISNKPGEIRDISQGDCDCNSVAWFYLIAC